MWLNRRVGHKHERRFEECNRNDYRSGIEWSFRFGMGRHEDILRGHGLKWRQLTRPFTP